TAPSGFFFARTGRGVSGIGNQDITASQHNSTAAQQYRTTTKGWAGGAGGAGRDREKRGVPALHVARMRSIVVLLCCPDVLLAEGVRFELTDGCPSAVFKTAALNHSATLPKKVKVKPEPGNERWQGDLR